MFRFQVEATDVLGEKLASVQVFAKHLPTHLLCPLRCRGVIYFINKKYWVGATVVISYFQSSSFPTSPFVLS